MYMKRLLLTTLWKSGKDFAYPALVTVLFLCAWIIGGPYSIYVPFLLAFFPIARDGIIDAYEKKISTELFLIFATALSLLVGQVQSITVVLMIMLIAKAVEHVVEEKTNTSINRLITLIPTTVTVVHDHLESEISLERVVPGMLVLIKTGGQIAVDGVIVKGKAFVNESFLTGESIPLEKNVSELVYAGTFIESGSLIIKVLQVGDKTYFGKISNLLDQAAYEKANIIAISHKAAFYIICFLVIFIATVWIKTGNLALVATLLVFGSPIELTLITPLAILAGTAAAFRCGILIKGSRALEVFARVDTLLFDKTGTLTMGQPEVVSVTSLDQSVSEKDLLLVAATLEKHSGHVLARAIIKKAQQEGLIINDPSDYESLTGHGVQGTINGRFYMLGSLHFIEAPEHGNSNITSLQTLTKEPSVTYFYIAADGKLIGRIAVSDVIRPDAAQTIQALRGLGIKKIILLSGDRIEVARHIGQQLGMDESYGEVQPDEKLSIIKRLQHQGCKIAMIGDGINDAPALKQANVGIALGAMGMEPAIDAADIVLTTNDLQGIVFMRILSQKILTLIMQNIFIGFVFIHALGIILALYGIVSPIQAALFHAISDILVLLNSARLINYSFYAKK